MRVDGISLLYDRIAYLSIKLVCYYAQNYASLRMSLTARQEKAAKRLSAVAPCPLNFRR